jgi:hypothetical protein
MPSLQWNKFIDAYATRYCVVIHFPDYGPLKKRAKGPILTREGKEFPSPNAIVREIAKRIKTDYTIKSGVVSQIVMMSDRAEAETFAKALGSTQWRRGDGAPCSATTACAIDGERMVDLAKKLKLV